jgi:hypothetical protein
MLFSGECVPRARAVAKLLVYLVRPMFPQCSPNVP